jgi:hypothetical protein
VREINVSRAGDPVHAGDKALTRETPAKRGRVNRPTFYDQYFWKFPIWNSCADEKRREIRMVKMFK